MLHPEFARISIGKLEGSIKSALSPRARCKGTISDAYAVPRKALFQLAARTYTITAQ